MAPPQSTTIALIKPDCATGYRAPGEGDTTKNGTILDEIMQRIKAEGFTITQRRTLQLSKYQVRQLYRHSWEDPELDAVLDFMVSGPCIAMHLERDNAVEHWKAVMGPMDPAKAKTVASPKPLLRGVYGSTPVRNAFYGSETKLCALRDRMLLFPTPSPVMQQALAIVKPTALNFVDTLSVNFEREGFFIMDQVKISIESDEEMLLLSESNDPAYDSELKLAMTTGQAVVFLLEGMNIGDKLELLLGPADPAEAQVYFPTSIRARLGVSLANNCVFPLHSVSAVSQYIQKWFPAFLALEPEHTLAIIKPETANDHADEIQNIIVANGFRIDRQSRRLLTREDAMEFYAEHKGKAFYEKLVAYMTSDVVIVMILVRVKAIYAWQKCMGPTNSLTAKEQYPSSIRGRYGIDGTRNATHGSDSRQSADREIQLVFNIPPAVALEASISTKDVAARPIKQLSPDKTLHEALARGVTLLCQQDPKLDGLDAIAWLGQYLTSYSTLAMPASVVAATAPAAAHLVRRPQPGKPADLGIPSLAALYIVGFFGHGANRTLLAKKIAKDFSYHYMDIDVVLDKKDANEDSMVAIVKAFKRCVSKRIILDKCPPDLTFYLSFQRHVARFAWITVVGDDVGDHKPPHPHASPLAPDLPFSVHAASEREFFDYFHRFGLLHYVSPRPHLDEAFTKHACLPDIYGAFCPRLLLVRDRNRVIRPEQWDQLGLQYRWNVLDFSILLEREVAREATKTHAGEYTTMFRTKEMMPFDMIVRLLAQAIAKTAAIPRFVITNVPSHALTGAFVTLLDTTVRASPTTQLVNVEPHPIWDAKLPMTQFEWRSHAVGHLVSIWVDGIATTDHLRSLLQPLLAPTLALSIDEGSTCGGGADITSVARTRGFLKLSAKDALRAEVLAGSVDGLHIQEQVQANEPIQDDLVVRVLQKVVLHPSHRRVILDDFPVTVEQVKALSDQIAVPSLVIRSQEPTTPFQQNLLAHLALSHPVVSPFGPNLQAHLSQLSASVVLGDVSDLSLSRLERHFQTKGVHVLSLAHVESSVEAMWSQPGHPIDDRSFVELVCAMLRQRNLHRVLFIGFPRTLLEAKTFHSVGVAMDHVTVLTKKVLPVPHALTDEDFYSSDEEEKARKKNAPEPQLSQLTRYFTETSPHAFHATTYVDIGRVYPQLEALFRPRVFLAVGNKASGFHSAVQRAAQSSNCVYVHVPTLHAHHVTRFPSSDRAKRIQAAWAERRLVDVAITMDLVKLEVLRHPISTRVVLTGFPRVIRNTMPYVHDQLMALAEHVGHVDQLLHFTTSPATLAARVGDVEVVHAHTDAFNAENLPLVDLYVKLNKVVTTLSADVSLDTLTQQVQTVLVE
ncbi:hypothetical protein H310_00517 [Aphanomyces invadans]|uniref:Nucleoside diphosphate kinase-like domain-containing protein n=1 Tax=Aphanomyces invadans TaxID=157072 RepID=A0A024UW35_9STRA|nr:hypothetical protein H310_00517 [Aphanomyces invadans]ETW10147.1 hypothetical protein H310_00517 [Aphanomyces invadans]|eukprot:XP_008861558.1 hypothetical protein H310_00517 [Aphanomyces invadans]